MVAVRSGTSSIDPLVVISLQHPLHAVRSFVKRCPEIAATRVDHEHGTVTDVRDELDPMVLVLAFEERAHRNDAVVESTEVLQLGVDGVAHESGVVVMEDGNQRLHENPLERRTPLLRARYDGRNPGRPEASARAGLGTTQRTSQTSRRAEQETDADIQITDSRLNPRLDSVKPSPTLSISAAAGA